MTGFPSKTSERDIFDFFSDIGLVPSVLEVKYENGSQRLDQVICEFSDNSKAKQAVSKNNMPIGFNQISVSLLPDYESAPSGGEENENLSYSNEFYMASLIKRGNHVITITGLLFCHPYLFTCEPFL